MRRSRSHERQRERCGKSFCEYVSDGFDGVGVFVYGDQEGVEMMCLCVYCVCTERKRDNMGDGDNL